MLHVCRRCLHDHDITPFLHHFREIRSNTHSVGSIKKSSRSHFRTFASCTNVRSFVCAWQSTASANKSGRGLSALCYFPLLSLH
jgi:hypothetical protein